MKSRIRKLFLLVLVCLMLLPPTPLYAAKEGIIDNLQPRSNLNMTVNPLPRKVDLVIDSDLMNPSPSAVEQLVNAEIVPMLEAEHMDYQITYKKPDGHVTGPVVWFGGFIDARGNLNLLDKSSWKNMILPENTRIIYGTYSNVFLDEQGNLACYYYGNNLSHNTSAATKFARIMNDPKGATYGIDASGNVYEIKITSSSTCAATITKISGFANVVDAAGTSASEMLIVDKSGNVKGKGSGLFNPRNSGIVNNGGTISGVSNAAEVTVINGGYRDGRDQKAVYVLTKTGEVYSWGDAYRGWSGSHTDTSGYLIKKINISEKIVSIDVGLSSTSSDAEVLVHLITDRGNVYLLSDTSFSKVASNMSHYYSSTQNVDAWGTIKPEYRSPGNEVIFAGYYFGGTFSRLNGTFNIWGGTSNSAYETYTPALPKGEIPKDVLWKKSSSSDMQGGVIVTESGNVYQWGESFFDHNDSGTYLVGAISNVDQFIPGTINWVVTKSGSVLVDANAGYNQYGQLGTGSKGEGADWAPVQVSNIVKLAVSGSFGVAPNSSATNKGFAIAIDRNGDLWGWGHKTTGTLNLATNADGVVPPQKLNVSFKAKDIVINYGIVVVLDTNGDVWTWGTSSDSNMNLGRSGSGNTPTKLTGIPKIESLAKYSVTDKDTVLLVGTDGYLYGWGYNQYGQVTGGSGSNTITKVTKNENISNVKQAVIGENYVAAQTVDGTIYTWGSGNQGRAGQGSSTVKTPTAIDPKYYSTVPIHAELDHLSASLDAVTWREGADRYYIHVTDQLGNELALDYNINQAASRLLVSKVHYVGLSSKNVNEMKKLVTANNHKGKVVTRTTNLTLNIRHIGQYIVKKQPVDLVFHIGTTSKDDIQLIEQKLQQTLVPQVEQYGVELKLTVTDGERITENRLYHVNNSDQIVVYDPLTNTNKTIVTRAVSNPMIHHSGDLFYLEKGTGKVYRYDTNATSNPESLYYTLESHALVTSSSAMVVDKDGYIWYQAKGDQSSDKNYYLKRVDPATGQIETIASNSSSFSDMIPGTNGGILYKQANSLYSASPVKKVADKAQDYVQAESGCVYYDSLQGSSWRVKGCGQEFELYSYPLATAGGQRLIYAVPGTYGVKDRIYLFDPELNTSRVLLEGTTTGITATPDKRLYYYSSVSSTTPKWINWETGQTGTLSVTLGNIIPYYYHNIETRRVRKITLLDGLRTTPWRADTDAYYVYMYDGTISGLNSIAQEVWADKVSFIGFGTSTNQSQIDSFVNTQINGHGKFINTSNLDTAISQLATYIISQAGLPKYEVNEDKVILEYDPASASYRSGEIVYDTNYEDPEKDPQYKERWIYAHHHTYYENSLGQLPEHNQTLTAPITVLTRPGKYTITYEVSDRPKADTRFAEFERWSEKSNLDIYAHRRPIADFSIRLTPSGNNQFQLTLTDRSYDPDRQSKSNRGIAEWQWSWKKYSDAQWTAGQPPAIIEAGAMYLVALRVKDEDGAWSDEKILPLAEEGFNNAPFAKFTVTSQIYYNQAYTIVDQSSDPDGDPITERRWKVSKDGINLYDSTTQPTAATLGSRAASNGLSIYGTYTITLLVRDHPLVGSALWSEPYSQNFEIVNQQPTAGFTWSPTALYQGNTVQVKHAVSDPEKATLSVRYEVTAPNGNVTYYPTSGSYSVAQANYSGNAFTISNLQGGTYKIVQTVSDEQHTKTLTKTMVVIANRAPVANFTWTPTTIWEGDTVSFTNLSSDPDGDALTYEWVIIYPNGSQYATSTDHPSVRLTQPGHYTVKLTVSDGRLTATRTQTLQVRQLTLAADVHHTEQWLAYHRDAGHETTTHPKDFYSGEKFILTAVTDAAPVRTLTATLTAVDREGETLNVTVTLNAVQAQSYRGEMYEDRFSSLERGLANGTYTIRFKIEYMNGTTKTADVPIRIIGHVLESVGVHRRR